MIKGAASATDARFPFIISDLPGPEAKRILALDARYVSPSYTRTYPMVARRGAGAMVEDVDGNHFLDFAAGIAVVATGHCHPRVAAAVKDQADKLMHISGTDFYYPPQVDAAEALVRHFPGNGRKRVHFGNSGAEAIEGAIMLAKFHTGR